MNRGLSSTGKVTVRRLRKARIRVWISGERDEIVQFMYPVSGKTFSNYVSILTDPPKMKLHLLSALSFPI